MTDILDQIAAWPAHGVRLSELQQKAVAEFVRAVSFDRDMDTVVGVALGIAIMINGRRRIDPVSTRRHVERIAMTVSQEWTGRS